jgi:hypothetical protein
MLKIVGSAGILDRMVQRVVGHGITAGGATFEAGAWWCRAGTGTRINVICRRPNIERITGAFRSAGGMLDGTQLTDHSADRLIFNVIGERTEAVLAEVGVFGPSGDPQVAPPFTPASIGGHEVEWLLESRRAALVIVEPTQAVAVWAALEEAGRRYAMSYVGVDAVERFAVLQRTRRSSLLI